jgi:hypothetical protein
MRPELTRTLGKVLDPSQGSKVFLRKFISSLNSILSPEKTLSRCRGFNPNVFISLTRDPSSSPLPLSTGRQALEREIGEE